MILAHTWVKLTANQIMIPESGIIDGRHQNKVVNSRCRAVTAKKCTKKRDARANLLFCQTTETYCFFDVLVDVAVVVA